MLDHAPLLRRSLVLNACFSTLTGLTLLLARGPLARLLGVETPSLLAGVGIVLLAFAGHLLWASRRAIPPAEVLYFVVSDALWVVGTAVLLFGFPGALSAAGRAAAAVVALLVGLLAVAQLRGWGEARRGAR
jgi:hypothetical protein